MAATHDNKTKIDIFLHPHYRDHTADVSLFPESEDSSETCETCETFHMLSTAAHLLPVGFICEHLQIVHTDAGLQDMREDI